MWRWESGDATVRTEFVVSFTLEDELCASLRSLLVAMFRLTLECVSMPVLDFLRPPCAGATVENTVLRTCCKFWS